MPRKTATKPQATKVSPIALTELETAESQLMAALAAVLEAKHARSCRNLAGAIGDASVDAHHARIAPQVRKALEAASGAIATLEDIRA